MINSFPMLQQMTEQEPEIREILTNPDLMRSRLTPENIAADLNKMTDMMKDMMNNMGDMGGNSSPFTMPDMMNQGTSSANPNANANANANANPFSNIGPAMMQSMFGGNSGASSDSRPPCEKYAE